MKKDIREKAIKHRLEGMSFNQIKALLGVSKSTLSRWLQKYPLSKNQMRTLRDWNSVRIEKFRQTMELKKTKRLAKTYEKSRERWLPLSARELFLAGLFLYWGEGKKGFDSSVHLNNTDPNVVKFFIYWLVKVLKIPRKKIKIDLHLYQDMDIEREIVFWSRVLRMPRSQFAKPYIKSSQMIKVTHKGFHHGTCGIGIGDARLKEEIIMTIQSIADHYNK